MLFIFTRNVFLLLFLFISTGLEAVAILQLKLTSIGDISNGTIIQLVEQVCNAECVKCLFCDGCSTNIMNE